MTTKLHTMLGAVEKALKDSTRVEKILINGPSAFDGDYIPVYRLQICAEDGLKNNEAQAFLRWLREAPVLVRELLVENERLRAKPAESGQIAGLREALEKIADYGHVDGCKAWEKGLHPGGMHCDCQVRIAADALAFAGTTPEPVETTDDPRMSRLNEMIDLDRERLDRVRMNAEADKEWRERLLTHEQLRLRCELGAAVLPMLAQWGKEHGIEGPFRDSVVNEAHHYAAALLAEGRRRMAAEREGKT